MKALWVIIEWSLDQHGERHHRYYAKKPVARGLRPMDSDMWKTKGGAENNLERLLQKMSTVNRASFADRYEVKDINTKVQPRYRARRWLRQAKRRQEKEDQMSLETRVAALEEKMERLANVFERDHDCC